MNDDFLLVFLPLDSICAPVYRGIQNMQNMDNREILFLIFPLFLYTNVVFNWKKQI